MKPLSTRCFLSDTITDFPNKLKISLDSRFSKLETFTRPKKIHQTNLGGQFLPCDYKKNVQKTKLTKENNRIVGPTWLSILPDLNVFYRTCPVGRTLLGKFAIRACSSYKDSYEHKNIKRPGGK